MDWMDERMGVSSSSSMPRIMQCLGSFHMEKKLADLGSNKPAIRGTRIHDVLGLQLSMESLSYSDKVCAERCAFEEARLVQEYSMEGAAPIREKRLYLKSKGRVYHTGKPDVVHALGKKLLVINFKTGWHAPEDPAINWQSVSEAILARNEHKATDVTAAMIHPNAPVKGAISQAYSYSLRQLKEYGAILESGCKAALKPDAQRVPGHHCKFCRGAKHKLCPEWREWSNQ